MPNLSDIVQQLHPVLVEARERGFLGPDPVERHIEHAARYLVPPITEASHCMDLGTGAGVPGLALALVTQCRWTLVDAMAKRCAFVADAVARLELGDRVDVIEGRAEVLGRDSALRGMFDAVVCRAFGQPAVVAECAAPFLRVGGVLVVSEPPQDDLASPRWDPDGLRVLGLQEASAERSSVVILEAVDPCPERFPRRLGIPAKRPLF